MVGQDPEIPKTWFYTRPPFNVVRLLNKGELVYEFALLAEICSVLTPEPIDMVILQLAHSDSIASYILPSTTQVASSVQIETRKNPMSFRIDVQYRSP